jgi:cytoskeleton protein RodZ
VRVTIAEAPSEAAAEPPVSGPGARLKAARESAGLSLDQAAQQLKLAPRQVRALEDEDYEHLPGRTFTRGFVRNYARLLNLDPEALLALLPDAGHAAALDSPALLPTGLKIAELPRAGADAPGLGRWLIPLVLVACVVAAAAYEWYRSGQTETVASAAVKPNTAAKSEAAKSEPSATAPAAGTTVAALPNPLAEEPKAEPSAPPPDNPSSAAALAAEEAAPASASAPTAAAPPAVQVPAPLLLSYRGPSWTEIRDRDGTLLVSRLVPAGSEQAVRGTSPFDVVIGNASAVTMVYRGKSVDLSRYAKQNVARLQLP